LEIDIDQLDAIKKLSTISFISFEEMGYSDSNDKGRLLKYVTDDVPDEEEPHENSLNEGVFYRCRA